ncbi:hypothetical protein OJAV_G00129620 [Oryzias javanicus]|uniref:Uncharacterized protein n=1 Tax=Oryzias javanicus TaxID=123683 RepID=A0A437CPQ4_ORYJA|nr:hypothetical protein OJAV_G00129620 [Oryzias javanicus]
MEGRLGRTDAPTYLVWSIFNTACCCLPLGIAAIHYSNRVKEANSVGNGVEAEDASRMARNLNITGVVLGLIFTIIFIVYYVNAHKVG